MLACLPGSSPLDPFTSSSFILPLFLLFLFVPFQFLTSSLYVCNMNLIAQ